MNLFDGQGFCGAGGLVQALLGVELAAPILRVSGFGGFCGCASEVVKAFGDHGLVCDEGVSAIACVECSRALSRFG